MKDVNAIRDAHLAGGYPFAASNDLGIRKHKATAMHLCDAIMHNKLF